MFTNSNRIGKKFGNEIKNELSRSVNVEIATGYFGYKVLNDFTETFLKIARRGSCRLLFGMIFHERATQKQKDCLDELNHKLKDINNESGVFLTIEPYHGKIFKLKNSNGEKFYVGSSNFSPSGFGDNTEFNLEIKNPEDQISINKFLEFLFYEKGENSIGYPLDLVELRLKNIKDKKDPSKSSLEDYKINKSEFPEKVLTPGIKILLRPDKQPKSSLNLYFQKGRKTKKDGRDIYSPRPWYEVEITTLKKEQLIKGYPKAEWTAFAEDNGNYYKLDMMTSGGNINRPKDIMSSKKIKNGRKGGRHILGQLIKGKLERKKCLKNFEAVTSETLDNYGRDFIELKKVSNKEYILEF
jgi:hypothetical protein